MSKDSRELAIAVIRQLIDGNNSYIEHNIRYEGNTCLIIFGSDRSSLVRSIIAYLKRSEIPYRTEKGKEIFQRERTDHDGVSYGFYPPETKHYYQIIID